MNFEDLKKNWNSFGEIDPLWSIINEPSKKGNKWNADDFFSTGISEIEAVLGYLKGLRQEVIFGNALDFGCGVGRLSLALGRHFAEVVGVDVAPAMIEHAKKYAVNARNVRYCLNQESDLGIFENETFDFIYSNIVLQHMEPRYSLRYLSEFMRVLKKGGVLVFQLPSEKTRSTWKQRLYDLAPRPVKTFYRRRQFKKTGPVMEMYCVRRGKVIKCIEGNGGRIIDISADSSPGPEFVSYRYCIVK